MTNKPGKFPSEEEKRKLREGYEELKRILKKQEEEKRKSWLDLLRQIFFN